MSIKPAQKDLATRLQNGFAEKFGGALTNPTQCSGKLVKAPTRISWQKISVDSATKTPKSQGIS
jgi:hypothetical protein